MNLLPIYFAGMLSGNSLESKNIADTRTVARWHKAADKIPILGLSKHSA